MKPTADRVLEEFDALYPDEKRRVYAAIIQREIGIPLVVTNDQEGLIKHIEDLLDVALTVSQKIL